MAKVKTTSPGRGGNVNNRDRRGGNDERKSGKRNTNDKPTDGTTLTKKAKNETHGKNNPTDKIDDKMQTSPERNDSENDNDKRQRGVTDETAAKEGERAENGSNTAEDYVVFPTNASCTRNDNESTGSKESAHQSVRLSGLTNPEKQVVRSNTNITIIS